MFWIRLAGLLLAPTPVALLVARFWWKRGSDAMMGNIVGAGVIFLCLLLVGFYEYSWLVFKAMECQARHVRCEPNVPSDIARYLLFTSVAFLDVFIVFLAGLRAEERNRRATRAKEWA